MTGSDDTVPDAVSVRMVEFKTGCGKGAERRLGPPNFKR